MNQSELNAALAADDQLEISKLQESLEYIKNCSNKVIDYVVFELQLEIMERDLGWPKKQQDATKPLTGDKV